jgi:hypothetical protein
VDQSPRPLRFTWQCGGLKFGLMEVEDVGMAFPGVKLAEAVAKWNSITG